MEAHPFLYNSFSWGVPTELSHSHTPRFCFSVPRGERVPEEGAAVFHPVHGRAVLLHGHSGAAYPPVPGAHGHRRQNGQ